MRVAIGVPYWGENPQRYANYQYVLPYLRELFSWGIILFNTRTERGAARNEIVRSAVRNNADVVVLCDADTFPEQYALREAIYGAQIAGGLHFAYDRYRLLTQRGTDLLLSSQKGWEDHIHAAGPGSLGGCFAIRPEDWWAAGGSPELTGWGFEDVMFAVQARTLLRPNSWHPGVLTCLYHHTECAVGSPQYEINISECKKVEALDGDVGALRNHMDNSDLWKSPSKIF